MPELAEPTRRSMEQTNEARAAAALPARAGG
jgi:hypothetical protein